MKFRIIIDKTKDEEVLVTAHARSELTDRLEALVTEASGTDRIVAYRDEDILLLTVDDIECVTVEEGKLFVIDGKNRKYRVKQRLFELEALLPPCFIRINKSALANERRIERFAAAFSGAVDAVFKCGHREYVSRRCFAQIKRRYDL